MKTFSNHQSSPSPAFSSYSAGSCLALLEAVLEGEVGKERPQSKRKRFLPNYFFFFTMLPTCQNYHLRPSLYGNQDDVCDRQIIKIMELSCICKFKFRTTCHLNPPHTNAWKISTKIGGALLLVLFRGLLPVVAELLLHVLGRQRTVLAFD